MQEIDANPSASRSYVIADAPGYRIVWHIPKPEAASEQRRLVITFGTLQSGIADSGFGTEFALKHGHPNIYVSPRRSSQYQELPLGEFFDAVAPIIDDERPVIYGASLGAYSAVYFGGSIDADIIAAAPQCPAMPELRMKHAQTTPMLHDHLLNVPRTSGKVVVLWDPHERPDSILVNDFIKIQYPDAAYLNFPYAGHKILETMSKVGVIKPFIRSLLRDTTITDVQIPTEGNPIWHCNFGKALFRKGKTDEALHHVDLSFNLKPSSENIQLLARIFMLKGMTERAKKLQEIIDTDNRIKKITFGPAQRNLASAISGRKTNN